MPGPALPEWHDFFMVAGTAAATLIGAMFVVVSLGIGILTQERVAAIRTFLTTTVISLSAVLFAAAVTMIPSLEWVWFGGIFGVAGIAGLAYSAVGTVGFWRHPGTEGGDWFWYAAAPPLAYASMLVSAGLSLRAAAESVELLAASVGLLMIASIRNAWDMIVFLVTRNRSSST